MFGGPDYQLREAVNGLIDDINAADLRQSTALFALIAILVDKGVFTAEEFERYRQRSVGPMEQLVAKLTEEAAKEEAKAK